MKFTQLFTKINKSAKEYDSKNATLLVKAGYIDQTMAGVYTFLPLGLRVLNKIESIVREQMDTIAQEVSMPALSPTSLWKTTKRLDSIDVLMKTVAANDISRLKHDARYILNPTHEEIITPIAKKFNASYKDLPKAVYQIQSKFRNEPRAKSGLLRGREFRMKDLYSFHATEEDLTSYYEKVKKVYTKLFTLLGIGKYTYITMASGGDFSKSFSHEFQTKCDTGEDFIFHVSGTNLYYNREVAPTHTNIKTAGEGDTHPESGKKYEMFRASEVGNIFLLCTKFSKAFDYTYTNQAGNAQDIYMGSYGIGTSRVMAVIVETLSDNKGLVWPSAISPFDVHLITLPGAEGKAQHLYNSLSEKGFEVLWDDRDKSAGMKFADCDMIGIPWRAVVSKKTGDKVEIKQRTKDETEIVDLEMFVKRLESS